MADLFEALEPNLSEGQKTFLSKKENMEHLLDYLKEPLMVKMLEKQCEELLPKYQKAKKAYERATAIYGIINNDSKLSKQKSKDEKEKQQNIKSINYFKEQIEIEQKKIRNSMERIADLKDSVAEKEQRNKLITDLSGNLSIADLPKEVARTKYDLDNIEINYLNDRHLLDSIYLARMEIRKASEIRTTKTTKVKKVVEQTITIKRENSVVSIHSKKTTTTVHTNDYITSDTEYHGDGDESITESTIERRKERWGRRSKRTEKRNFRIDENEALRRRCKPEKPLSFDPENIEANN